MAPKIDPVTEFWYRALASPIGVLLQAPDVETARQRLYRARQRAGDPALAGLQLRAVQFPDGNLVIVRAEFGAAKGRPPGAKAKMDLSAFLPLSPDGD